MTEVFPDEPWKSLWLHVWGPLVVAAPALAFPFARPALSMVLITGALAWCLAVNRYGPEPALTWRIIRSPLTLPVSVVVFLAVVGTADSSHPEWSVPKFAGLVLGLLIGRATMLTATSPFRVRRLALTYAVLGLLVIALAALAGPHWRGLGSGYIYDLGARFIPVLVRIPGVGAGPNTNAIGGTTLFFIPVAAAMLWQLPQAQPSSLWRNILGRGWWLLSLLSLVFVLVVSQSRTAWLSALVVLSLLLVVRFRTAAVVGGFVVVASAVVTAWIGPLAALQRLLARLQPVIGSLDNGDRTVIWKFAIHGIRDHPWFGVGFGTFREVIHSMTVDGSGYPLPVPHAHNTFLQVGLDLGLVGLAAYITLLVVATRLTWRICRSRVDGWLRSLAFGFWGALVATHVFGLTDCIALGAKVGIFFWIHLAFISAVDGLGGHTSIKGRSSPNF